MTTAIDFLKTKRHNPLSDEEFWDWDLDLMTPKEVKALFIEFEQLINSESPQPEAKRQDEYQSVLTLLVRMDQRKADSKSEKLTTQEADHFYKYSGKLEEVEYWQNEIREMFGIDENEEPA